MKVQSASNLAHTPSASDTPSGIPASYAARPVGQVHVDPAIRSLARDDSGQAFIKQGAQTFPVRYDKDNATWRVFSPENPTRYPYPVRQDSSGAWQTHSDVGLRGGYKGDPMAALAAAQRITQLQQQITQLDSRLQQVRAAQQEGAARMSELSSRLATSNLPDAEKDRQWREAIVATRTPELAQERQALEQDLNQLRGELQQLQNTV